MLLHLLELLLQVWVAKSGLVVIERSCSHLVIGRHCLVVVWCADIYTA